MGDVLGPSASGMVPTSSSSLSTSQHDHQQSSSMLAEPMLETSSVDEKACIQQNFAEEFDASEFGLDDDDDDDDVNGSIGHNDRDVSSVLKNKTDDSHATEARLIHLENEHDILNTSLVSLSTQFAQVQFRLKQIGSAATAEERDALLKELELIAFEGCPDLYTANRLLQEEQQKCSTQAPESRSETATEAAVHSKSSDKTSNADDDNVDADDNEDDDDELLSGVNNHKSKSLGSALRSQMRLRERDNKLNKKISLTTSQSAISGINSISPQTNSIISTVQPSKSGDAVVTTTASDADSSRRRLEIIDTINKFRKQVEDLESLAYQQGHIDAPPAKHILARQKEVIDQLRSRLNIKVGEDFEKLSKAELRQRLDAAIGNVIIPIKEKELICEQLLHQVKDLERFIEFLQTEHPKSVSHTNQPPAVGSAARSAAAGDSAINDAVNKAVRVLPRQSTSEFAANSFDDASVLLASQNDNNNMSSSQWISTVASKSHAVLQVLTYMLMCGSRPFPQQHQHQQSGSSEQPYDGSRRDSIPLPPVITADVQRSINSSRNVLFKSNVLKATPAGSHWGDERAVLELAIARVKSIIARVDAEKQHQQQQPSSSSRNAAPVVKEKKISSSYDFYDFGTNLEHYYYYFNSDDDDDDNAAAGTSTTTKIDDDVELMIRQQTNVPAALQMLLVRCIRRELAPALMALMRHGYAPNRLHRSKINPGLLLLRPDLLIAHAATTSGALNMLPSIFSGKKSTISLSASKSLANFAAVQQQQQQQKKSSHNDAKENVKKIIHDDPKLHPWKLVMAYYDLKDGATYNRMASKKLADAFGLPLSATDVNKSRSGAVSSSSVTTRETLLTTIGDIVESHTKLKRSMNSHFKALVCAGLNMKALNSWLRLIYGVDQLVDGNYESWSYAVRTHFSDTINALDQLNAFDFNLPVNFAIRRLQNLNDAF